MAQQGIKITDLRPEIQTLVNSDPTKYDPNKNGVIDDGDELSQLLSEYQCTRGDLNKQGGETMLTCFEKLEVNDYVSSHNEFSKIATGTIVGGGALLSGIAGIIQIGESTDKGFFSVTKKLGKVTKTLSPYFRSALFGLGLSAVLGTAAAAIIKGFDNSAEKESIDKIKAQQAADGERIMAQRRQEEAERVQREEALKQEELEYRERMNTATSSIEQNISTADKKAKSVNRELDKIKKEVTAKNDSTAVAG